MAKNTNNGANLGFESELWRAADALFHSNMDTAEYKHVVLGLIFLKYIADAFEEQRARLEAERAQGADPEDPDEYRAVNIFWVPKEARWSKLKAEAKQPTIGKVIDDAMLTIERDNPSLKGVLPKDYAHLCLDKQRLGQLIDLVGNIGLGDKENRHLSPTGFAGFVLANGSISSNQSGEGDIRKNIIEADLVSPEVGATTGGRLYEDIPGFCKSATIEDICKHGYILTRLLCRRSPDGR